MGAYAPAPVVTEDMMNAIMDRIARPTVIGMNNEGRPYKGLLYIGLMITRSGPKVVEYNCRFGDPETQAVLPLFKGDLVEALLACTEERLDQISVEPVDKSAVCVVLTAGGYPGDYEKGKVITGLDQFGNSEEIIVFHAGTKLVSGQVVTNGGRVLGVTAIGDTLQAAAEQCYQAVEKINFQGMHFRRDIGYRALGREKNK
jgi:phosphoribosylamine--glycine ligase